MITSVERGEVKGWDVICMMKRCWECIGDKGIDTVAW